MNNHELYNTELSQYQQDLGGYKQGIDDRIAQAKSNFLENKWGERAQLGMSKLKSAHELATSLETMVGGATAPELVENLIKPAAQRIGGYLGYGTTSSATPEVAGGDGEAALSKIKSAIGDLYTKYSQGGMGAEGKQAGGFGDDDMPTWTRGGAGPEPSNITPWQDTSRVANPEGVAGEGAPSSEHPSGWGLEYEPEDEGFDIDEKIGEAADVPDQVAAPAPARPGLFDDLPEPERDPVDSQGNLLMRDSAPEGEFDPLQAALDDPRSAINQGLPRDLQPFAQDAPAEAPAAEGSGKIVGTLTGGAEQEGSAATLGGAGTSGGGATAQLGKVGAGVEDGLESGLGEAAVADWWNPLGIILGIGALGLGAYEGGKAIYDDVQNEKQQKAIAGMAPPPPPQGQSEAGSYVVPTYSQLN